MSTEAEILSLARYHVWARMMRHSLEQSLERDDAVNDESPGITTFAMMSYWYGALYVVIEGWQQLKLVDEAIDGLLSDDEKVQNLRRYRNATFRYYQQAIYHEKFLRLMRGAGETAGWVQALHCAFERFLADWPRESGYLDDEVLKDYKKWRERHPLALWTTIAGSLRIGYRSAVDAHLGRVLFLRCWCGDP